MPKEVVIQQQEFTRYVCNVCNASYEGMVGAVRCEAEHKLKQTQKECKHGEWVYASNVTSDRDFGVHIEITRVCGICGVIEVVHFDNWFLDKHPKILAYLFKKAKDFK